jgi:hydrogenase-4 component E
MNYADSLIYLISSLIAVSAFYIQGQEFIVSMIRGQSVQSVLIAVVAFIIAWEERSYDFIILGALIIILRAFLVNYFLQKRIPKQKSYIYEGKVNLSYLFLVDLIFIVISVFILYSVAFSGIVLHSFLENSGNSGVLVFPLTLFFQGLFLIASRRTTFTQIIGYVEEENSLVLFAMFLLPIPIIIEASVFLDVLALVVISSIVVLEKFTHEPVEELRG